MKTAAIPVSRPLLPTTQDLLPYLEQIDARRIYSNWGPLNTLLERRLGTQFSAQVVTVSSATAGITCTLRALLEDRPAELRNGLCLMPSWGFVATPHAALAAGLTPCFLDVEEGSWMLTPDLVRRELLFGVARQGGPGRSLPVSAVIAVAPFGLQVDPEPWDEFTAQTGIPVIIDAAAAFDGLAVTRTPAIVSLHATKSVCAGEGGFVATTDAELAKRVKRVANFGFFGARLAEVPAFNGKLSEYHAAVGLSSLDGWEGRRAKLMEVAQGMRAALEPLGVGFQQGFGTDWVSSTCVVRLPAGMTMAETAIGLGLRGVTTRAWWGYGCHTSPAFEHLPRRSAASHDGLPMTEVLANATIGLPFYIDLRAEEVARIRDAMAELRPAGARRTRSSMSSEGVRPRTARTMSSAELAGLTAEPVA
jgi:dTDP-4-amino-4,6-dideoxygalactose transaminase